MSKVFDEGNLKFDFSAYNTAERFDDEKTNPHGMKAVDFIAETKRIIDEFNLRHVAGEPRAVPDMTGPNTAALDTAVPNMVVPNTAVSDTAHA
jgi:hypothetical protein